MNKYVKNCKHGKPGAAAAYVGRRSSSIPSGIVGSDGRYGNPIVIDYKAADAGAERARVVRAHREWILSDTPATNALRLDVQTNLRGRDLYCWCAPLECHATVLAEIANGSLK